MRRSTRRLLERLGEEAFNQLTHYRYNRSDSLHPRYRKGRIAALRWICDLSGYYLEREEALGRELLERIDREMEAIAWVDPGPYRQGIEDAVSEMRSLLEGQGVPPH